MTTKLPGSGPRNPLPLSPQAWKGPGGTAGPPKTAKPSGAFRAAWTIVGAAVVLPLIDVWGQQLLWALIRFAWVFPILGGIATGWWFLTASTDESRTFHPGQWVRDTRLDREGQVVGPGDPGRTQVKWRDTWDVTQADNDELQVIHNDD